MALFVQLRYDPDRGGRFLPTRPLAGADLLTLLHEAQALGERLECGVEFDFNGHLAWITPTQDVTAQYQWLWRLWYKEDAPC